MENNKLVGQFSAKVWAEEFVKMVKERPEIATDEGTMIAWFANAIMAGYDKAIKNNKQYRDELLGEVEKETRKHIDWKCRCDSENGCIEIILEKLSQLKEGE